MVSGQQALGSINQALQQVRTELREMDRQIQSVSDQGVRLRQTTAVEYQKLAEIRTDELTRGAIISGLSDADRRVNELLDQRRQKLESQEKQLDECHARQLQLESEHSTHGEVVAEASRAMDRAEAATQERLKKDATYRAQLDAAHQADNVAKQAEEKTEQSEVDRLQKGKPYESDPLFMYLWKRRFGTPEYEAGALTRFLDKWVARLCRYHDSRPNFAMLGNIPVRLGEHSRRVRTEADHQFEALEALEEAAAAADGIPELRNALEQAKQTSDKIEAAIEQQENRYHQLVGERSLYASGEDEYSRQCTEVLVSEMRRESIVRLRQQAEATPSAKDDLVIQELADVESEQGELDDLLRHHKNVHERHLKRLHELEEVRRNFKRNSFDGEHSTFTNGALVGAMLTEFLRGMANSGDLWKSIQRNQRSGGGKSNPSFGSGGFGRPQGGVWKTPAPRAPRPTRRSGGGGFRTGGGF